MVSPTRHRDRVATHLLEAAALELTVTGPHASMADVAERAGVSRATLYNYFATRDELLEALTVAAIEAADARLHQIDLDRLSVEEAIEQMSVALVSCGIRFAVVISPLRDPSPSAGETLIRPRLEQLLRRGVDEGVLAGDLSVELMMTFYFGLLLGALLASRAGEESPSALGTAAARVFLRGAAAGR